jgi:AcrR family transcriptional regulator
MEASQDTRRTANIRVRGRAADVVARVMSATAHELSRVGYAAFRVEDVAARSGVNKTTIYRRWPNKSDLVAYAVSRHLAEALGRSGGSAFDTGTLRGDLRASLLVGVDLSPAERGMLRLVTERSAPEIEVITRRARDELQRVRLAIVERAVARGELPKGIDAELVIDLVSAPVQRALIFDQRLNASYIERVIDVVLAGVVATSGKPRAVGAARKRVRGARKARRARPIGRGN